MKMKRESEVTQLCLSLSDPMDYGLDIERDLCNFLIPCFATGFVQDCAKALELAWAI